MCVYTNFNYPVIYSYANDLTILLYLSQFHHYFKPSVIYATHKSIKLMNFWLQERKPILLLTTGREKIIYRVAEKKEFPKFKNNMELE